MIIYLNLRMVNTACGGSAWPSRGSHLMTEPLLVPRFRMEACPGDILHHTPRKIYVIFIRGRLVEGSRGLPACFSDGRRPNFIRRLLNLSTQLFSFLTMRYSLGWIS